MKAPFCHTQVQFLTSQMMELSKNILTRIGDTGMSTVDGGNLPEHGVNSSHSKLIKKLATISQ